MASEIETGTLWWRKYTPRYQEMLSFLSYYMHLLQMLHWFFIIKQLQLYFNLNNIYIIIYLLYIFLLFLLLFELKMSFADYK